MYTICVCYWWSNNCMVFKKTMFSTNLYNRSRVYSNYRKHRRNRKKLVFVIYFLIMSRLEKSKQFLKYNGYTYLRRHADALLIHIVSEKMFIQEYESSEEIHETKTLYTNVFKIMQLIRNITYAFLKKSNKKYAVNYIHTYINTKSCSTYVT